MKKWYQSRTLWLNVVGALAYFVQQQFGFLIPESLQIQLLAALNIALRFDTDEAIKL